jgi:hypothetical protein
MARPQRVVFDIEWLFISLDPQLSCRVICIEYAPNTEGALVPKFRQLGRQACSRHIPYFA